MRGVKGSSVTAGHPNYSRWENIKQRCNNPKNTNYHKYGGRGIKICERWQNNFYAFNYDIGLPPSTKHQLDRIDNDGDYEPGNVRWATPIQQMGNTRLPTRNTSGYRGVCWAKRRRKWHAQIGRGTTRKGLGYYDTKEEAAYAYDRAAVEHFGIEFATLNFPENYE
jgi:hypothetical protein